MSVKIHQNILCNNRCYKQGRILHPQGLMLHSVGVNQSKASVFYKSWNNEECKVAVHAFIDANSGDVHQTLPWNVRGWHAGGAANNTHIGVEMCEPDGISYRGGSSFSIKGDINVVRKQVQTAYASAVELFATLCYTELLIPMRDGVIISHAEGHKRGIASNHGDPEHLWSKKELELGYTMDGFREDVAAKYKEMFANQNGSFLIDVVLTDNLPWIRTGPGVQYPHIDAAQYILMPGRYTIVEVNQENGRWGRLKSGIGWINLTNKSIQGV